MQGEGPQLLLSEAVSRAAKAAGARPLTSPESLSRDLEAPEVQESYRQQVPPLCSRIGMVCWEGLGQDPASLDGQGFPCGIWEGLAISYWACQHGWWGTYFLRVGLCAFWDHRSETRAAPDLLVFSF
jgi:hypothetical protein